MNPYCKLALKSVSIFIGSLTATTIVKDATGQISLYDWLALGWPGVVALAAYWGGVADSTPAPWTRTQD